MNKLIILGLLLLLGYYSASAQNTAQVHPWKMNRGAGTISLTGTNIDMQKQHGNPVAYSLASIPAKDDKGWEDAPVSADVINFDESSSVPCLLAVDFTYFRTFVHIPSGGRHNLKVKIGYVDDGARMYIFNSKHPQVNQTNGSVSGYYNPSTDGRLSGADFEVDFTDQVVPGEINTIMYYSI